MHWPEAFKCLNQDHCTYKLIKRTKLHDSQTDIAFYSCSSDFNVFLDYFYKQIPFLFQLETFTDCFLQLDDFNIFVVQEWFSWNLNGKKIRILWESLSWVQQNFAGTHHLFAILTRIIIPIVSQIWNVRGQFP